MANLTSFQSDIRPLFTDRDVHAMSKAFNLASYDDVKTHASAIYDRIRGIGGAIMPPPPPRGEGAWLNLGLTYSPSGWRKGTNLNRFTTRQGPQVAGSTIRHTEARNVLGPIQPDGESKLVPWSLV